MAPVVLIAIAVILLIILHSYISRPKKFPPGPWGVPILGYAVFVDKLRIYKTYDDLRKRFGDVVGLKLGLHNVVLISGWEAVHEALLNDDLAYRPRFKVSTELYPGEQHGVMLNNGATWREQRRFTLHHFRNLGFGRRSHESIIQEEADYLVDQLLKEARPVDLKVPVGVSNINILWAIISGRRREHSDPTLQRLVALLNRGMRAGTITGGLLNGFPFLRWIAPGYFGYNEIKQAFGDIKSFVEEAVDEHQRTFDPTEMRDFIDIYIQELRKENKGASFTDKQMIALIGDLFTAGTETSSSLVSFACLFLCKHQHLQQQLQARLDEVVGRGNLPNLDHRPRLAEIDAFLNETIRCRNPVPVAIPHYAQRDTTVQGHFIASGCRVNINLNSVSMDPEYWGDPENFRPDRFLTPEGALRKEERLIPFGKGKRACLGESLARMTTFLVFATLVHRVKIRFVDAVAPSDEGITGFTRQPINFKVLVTERPWGLPFLGYAPFVNLDQITKTYDDLQKAWGDVVGLRMGPHNVVFINGWEAVQEALLNRDLAWRPRLLVSPELYPGEQKGILLHNGETWSAQRRFTLHHIRNLGFGKRSHESVISDEANYLVDQLLKQKGPVDIKVPVSISNINILWAITAGKRHEHDDPNFMRLVALLGRGMRAGCVTGGMLNAYPFLRFICPKYLGFDEINQAFSDIRIYIQEAVDEHRKNFNPNDLRDFMDIYIHELTNEGKDPSFSEKQMIALFGDLFTAGTDTGTSLVSFSVLFACKYPHLQLAMQRQLDEVVGRGNRPALDHRNKLTLVDAFLNETLRYRNPVPIAIPHYAQNDTTVKGHFIAKGCRVNINLHSVSMDPEYWGDPETFRPDRFLTPEGTLRKEERLIPFGKGKRSCLGESLARMTSFILFATLLHKLSFKFVEGQEPSDEGVTGFTQAPVNFDVIISERK